MVRKEELKLYILISGSRLVDCKSSIGLLAKLLLRNINLPRIERPVTTAVVIGALIKSYRRK